MSFRVSAVAIIAAFFIAAAGAAFSQSRVIFQYKNWEVRVAAFDDGTISCVAQVQPANGTTFAIWADGRTVKLQFYSDVWSFGSSSADVVARIDRRAGWNLSNADLYKNSVIFTMPGGEQSTRFLLEVANGNTIYLSQSSGNPMGYWTLAGSKASMRKLIECVNYL